jgi:hypothetical protein
VVFLNPDVPRWTPTTEADIQHAIADGILEESHWWDAKRQLNPGPMVNKAFAADLAAFAIDGGSLLVGLHEDKETGTFSPALQPTATMPERIGSIATSVIDPPLYVVTTPIPSEQTGENGESLGYLLVEVPPSARAPHQVDGVYYGRGDKQNIRLSDAEVQRHHALRESLTHKGEALLAAEVARDAIPLHLRGGGHIYLVAEPLSAAPDVATRFLRGEDTRDWVWRVNATVLLDVPHEEAEVAWFVLVEHDPSSVQRPADPGGQVVLGGAHGRGVVIDPQLFGLSKELLVQVLDGVDPTGKAASGRGNRYLARVLGEAAVSAARTDTFLGERYRRIARRRGKKRAIVAVGRSILVIIWALLSDEQAQFVDLGPDYYANRNNPERRARHHIRELQTLGYSVTLNPAA